MTAPNAEQLTALRAYAKKRGNDWKSDLCLDWMNGRDASRPDGHLLRQLRNTLGPSWLLKFKLPAE